jgi:hypothetical protein
MLSHGIPPIIVAGMLGHSLAILMTRHAHLARYACYARYSRYTRNISGTQDEPLGFASRASAARVMDDILTPIPIDLKSLHPKS